MYFLTYIPMNNAQFKNTIPNTTIEIKYVLDAMLVSKIVVDKDYRNQGLGTKLMNELCSFADKHDSMILLTPSVLEYDTFYKNLKPFYKKFGFVKRRGYYHLPLASLLRHPKQITNESLYTNTSTSSTSSLRNYF